MKPDPSNMLKQMFKEAGGVDVEFVDCTPPNPHTDAALDATRSLEQIVADRANRMRSLEEIYNNEGISDEDRTRIEDQIVAEISKDDPELESKVIGWTDWLDFRQNEINGADWQIKRWQAIKAKRQASYDRDFGLFNRCMKILGGAYKTALVWWQFQKNPHVLVIENEAAIPSRLANPANAKYWNAPVPQPWTVNKAALKEALKTGELKPEQCGCKLVQGERLVDKNQAKAKK